MRAASTRPETDWINPAPHAGFAWTPKFEEQLARRRSSAAATRRSSAAATTSPTSTKAPTCSRRPPGNNPGQSQSLLLQPGTSIHGRQPDAAVAAAAIRRRAGGLQRRHPAVRADLRQHGHPDDEGRPQDRRSSQSWNIGVQRLIMKNTVIEARYLGNKGHNVWHTFNLNEVNIFENGFVNEFKLAAEEPRDQRGQRPAPASPTRVSPARSRCRSSTPRSAPAARSRRCRPTRGTPTAGSSPTCTKVKRAAWRQPWPATRPTSAGWSATRSRPAPTRNYTAPGPYPMNFFVANPYAIGGGGQRG